MTALKSLCNQERRAGALFDRDVFSCSLFLCDLRYFIYFIYKTQMEISFLMLITHILLDEVSWELHWQLGNFLDEGFKV